MRANESKKIKKRCGNRNGFKKKLKLRQQQMTTMLADQLMFERTKQLFKVIDSNVEPDVFAPTKENVCVSDKMQVQVRVICTFCVFSKNIFLFL